MVSTKIAVVGSGFVGSTTAYTLLLHGLASELVIIDANKDKAQGDAKDLSQGASFVKPARVYAGNIEEVSGSTIVILTAGASQKPGESRLDLAQKNIDIFREIIPKIAAGAPDSILLVVTNPVDVLTYVTLRLSGFPPHRVIGSGTVLDTSRFKHLLSEHCGVDARNIHAVVIGEHGDSEVLVWSLANIVGVDITRYCPLCGRNCLTEARESISHSVRTAAYDIITKKGATYYAVALAVTRICEAILRDEHSILTVSGLVEEIYGIENVCLSLPAVVSRLGRGNVLVLPLSEEEKQALEKSAATIRETIDRYFR